MKKITLFLRFLLSMVFQTGYAIEPTTHCPALTGRVIAKHSSTYNKARLLSNYYPSKNKFPNAIVYCQNTQDVQNALQYAHCHNIPIRVRSGGHNHEGFSTGNGVIIIDVSEMKQLQIDKPNKIITVQPGITGGELYEKLTDVGLTQVGGTCYGVGVSGLILTGGMGPLLRKQGMACDSLISLDVVNAKGDLIHATKTNEHKDLFWASCGGGGGNFGVVTSMKLHVYSADPVTWFNIGWEWDQPIDDVIIAWQDFFAKNDDRWFSHLDVWAKAFPTKKFHKYPVKALGVFWGTPEEARRELEPLLKTGHPVSQIIERVEWKTAIKSFEEATAVFVTSKPEYKTTGSYAMKPLPIEAIHTITATLRNTNSPLFNVLFFSLGGAVKKVSPTDTAYFYRNAEFFVLYSDQWLKESNATHQIAEVDALRHQLLPYTTGDYIGNPDRNLSDYMTTYYGENVHRLRCIKRTYDPSNVFQFEQSIVPAPEDWGCK